MVWRENLGWERFKTPWGIAHVFPSALQIFCCFGFEIPVDFSGRAEELFELGAFLLELFVLGSFGVNNHTGNWRGGRKAPIFPSFRSVLQFLPNFRIICKMGTKIDVGMKQLISFGVCQT